MVSENQKRNIINKIFAMKHLDTEWLSDYQPEEQQFIIELARTQKKDKGFEIELNGIASDVKTHTKFRKIVFT